MNFAPILVSGIYLTCTMAITTLSMVLTVLVLNLHSINDRPIPGWVRVIVLDYLAKLVCKSEYEKPANKLLNRMHKMNTAERLANHVTRNKYHSSLTSVADAARDVAEQVPIIAVNGGGSVMTNHDHHNHSTHAVTSSQQQKLGFVNLRNNNISRSKAKTKLAYNHTSSAARGATSFTSSDASYCDSDGTDATAAAAAAELDYGKDWQKLAEVVDRMFFWIFLLAIIAVSLLLFHPLGMRYGLKPGY